MNTTNFITILVSLMGILATSCGNNSTSPIEVHKHVEHVVETTNTTINNQVNKYQNELGQALDRHGNILMGCPIHKEMIGVQGDQCPKCDYMEMLPVTWSLQDIDTIRVKSIPNYNTHSDQL